MGDQQVRGEMGAKLEGGQILSCDDSDIAEQRAWVGYGNNLPVKTAAAAGVRPGNIGGKYDSTDVQN